MDYSPDGWRCLEGIERTFLGLPHPGQLTGVRQLHDATS